MISCGVVRVTSKKNTDLCANMLVRRNLFKHDDYRCFGRQQKAPNMVLGPTSFDLRCRRSSEPWLAFKSLLKLDLLSNPPKRVTFTYLTNGQDFQPLFCMGIGKTRRPNGPNFSDISKENQILQHSSVYLYYTSLTIYEKKPFGNSCPKIFWTL